MKTTIALLTALLLAPLAALPAADLPKQQPIKWHPGHYIFVGHGEIRPEHLLEHFRGVQKCYAWTKLEPAQGS